MLHLAAVHLAAVQMPAFSASVKHFTHLLSCRKLTREELERKEKESKLSEVDKKTLRAAEEVEVHKRRIQEMEEEMEKTERFNKNLVSCLFMSTVSRVSQILLRSTYVDENSSLLIYRLHHWRRKPMITG